MYKINDPMFAVILRFAGGQRNIAFRDEAFIKKQLKAIRKYIAQFPAEEQERRTLEWIEEYSREYRATWEKRVIGRTLSHERCPDCPLASAGDAAHCRIHDEWVRLLQKYAADRIGTQKYVSEALRILSQHKENLKVTLRTLERRPHKRPSGKSR